MADLKGKRERWLVWLMGLILVLGTVACYWPVRNFDYVNLDDTLYVTDTPMVQKGLTWAGTVWAFKNVDGGNWNPLVWLSHMADIQMYGKAAGGHHMTNVLLHAANVVLLFIVLHGMTGAFWRSALAAALFAWHPLHVESVAWISERKDVLSTFFWLLTMGAYVKSTRHQARGSRIYYGLALAFFVCGLMSKPMVVTLPVVLLIMDFWPLKRVYDLRFTIYALKKEVPGAEDGAKLQKRAGNQARKKEKKAVKSAKDGVGNEEYGGVAVVSLNRALREKRPFFLLAAAGSVLAIWSQKKVNAMGSQGFLLRLENAASSYATYLGEFFWPGKLAVTYPYPVTIAVESVVGATAVLSAITLWTVWTRRERPYLAAGWIWFLVTLLPVIGLVQVGKQAMADRYTYVPYIGLGLIVSWGLGELAGRGVERRIVAAGIAGLALAGCVMATRAQAEYWRNSKALYEHALQVVPVNSVAHNNLGILLAGEGKDEEAAAHLRETVRLEPDNASAFNELGKTYLRLKKMDEAMLMFSNAARVNPGLAQARWNLGNAYLVKGDVTNALAEMKAGVELSPDDVEAHARYGELLIKLGRVADSESYWRMVVKTLPDDAHARFALGQAHLAQKDFKETVADFKEAIRLAPESPQCLNALAWIDATCPQAELRNGAEAVRLAEKACALTKHQNAALLDTLAAAHAEADQFEDAMKVAEEARALAIAAHDATAEKVMEQRLDLYKAGNPYREAP